MAANPTPRSAKRIASAVSFARSPYDHAPAWIQSTTGNGSSTTGS